MLNIVMLHYQKKDMVITLANLQQGVKVSGQSIVIDDDRLFNRLIAIAERSNDLEPYFEYELTNTPASLFKDGFMRKPNKSSLMHAITKDVSQSDEISHGNFVFDGGVLLHRVSGRNIQHIKTPSTSIVNTFNLNMEVNACSI